MLAVLVEADGEVIDEKEGGEACALSHVMPFCKFECSDAGAGLSFARKMAGFASVDADHEIIFMRPCEGASVFGFLRSVELISF